LSFEKFCLKLKKKKKKKIFKTIKTIKMEEKKNYELEDFKIGCFTIDNGFSKKLPSNCLQYLKDHSKDFKNKDQKNQHFQFNR
jgi:regulatory protein YycH of two-component signal transduction system YycFG